MHELSIASAVVATVERHARGCSVEVVNLRVGKLRQVVPDTLRFYLGFVARETVCAGARIEIEVVPVRLRCAACQAEWKLEHDVVFRCSNCGSREVEVVAGDELQVETIEIEEEAPCTARP